MQINGLQKTLGTDLESPHEKFASEDSQDFDEIGQNIFD